MLASSRDQVGNAGQRWLVDGVKPRGVGATRFVLAGVFVCSVASSRRVYILNHLLAVSSILALADLHAVLAWRPLELAQSVWPQRRPSSRFVTVSSDPGSLVAPYRPFVVTPPVMVARAHS